MLRIPTPIWRWSAKKSKPIPYESSASANPQTTGKYYAYRIQYKTNKQNLHDADPVALKPKGHDESPLTVEGTQLHSPNRFQP